MRSTNKTAGRWWGDSSGRQTRAKVGRCVLMHFLSDLSVSDEVDKRDREGSSSHRLAFDVAQLRRKEAEVEGQRAASEWKLVWEGVISLRHRNI
ncbi:hypothetical protein F2P81_003488 [Scophthalmus maximus]|uniref:Uncharacterized protein n=1 Tax=Scophthalmus maximus TaxID=52904 RepID=A0A6A4TL39_SCOMX|nr:hypothetical protein F2P81_003488 [Scophthalmus maximus]